MEQELLKLKEVLDEKRINVNSKKSKRWNASDKKPLSIVDNKYIGDTKHKNISSNTSKPYIQSNNNIKNIKEDKENIILNNQTNLKLDIRNDKNINNTQNIQTNEKINYSQDIIKNM